jgi:3-phytase
MRRFLVAVALFTLTMSLVRAQSTEVTPTVETEPSPNNGANGVTIWLHPTDSAQSTVIATDKESGLVVYDLAGKQLQFVEDGELENVDLRYNFPLDDAQVTLVGATNSASGEVLLYTVDDDTRELTAAGTITPALGDISGFCLYRSKATGKYFAFVNNEDGDVEQFELSAADGEVVGESVRTFGVGSEAEGCAADDDLGNLYIGEQEVGIWKYGAEPETANSRKLVDTVGDHIIEEVEGLTLYYPGEEAGYLIA